MPYNEHAHTRGARWGSTEAAVSRCISLVDHFHGSAGGLAFVLQKPFEHAPAAVQDGLGHPRLDELLAAHVANEDILIPVNNLASELMKRIRTAASGASM